MRFSRLAAAGLFGVSVLVGAGCGTSATSGEPRPYPWADAEPPPTRAPEDETRAPTSKANSLEFYDTNPIIGVVDGEGRIVPSSSPDATFYDLYWTSDDGTRLSLPLLSLPMSRSPVAFRLAAKVPPGATKLLVVSRNEKGESRNSTSAWLDDSVRTRISVGQTGDAPAVVLDGPSAKLIIATSGFDSLNVFRCNLDGTACTHNAVSTPEPIKGARPSIVVDEQGGKLIMAAMSNGSQNGPVLYHCSPDGAACVSRTLPVTFRDNANARVVIDKATAKLVVVAETGFGLGLWRCELDGTGCGYQEAEVPSSPGVNAIGGRTPSVALTNGKLVIAVRSGLVVCDPDTTGCTASGYPGIVGMRHPAMAVSEAGALFIAGLLGNGLAPETRKLALVRCASDGSACVALDIAATMPSLLVRASSLVIDELAGKLLVALLDDDSHAGVLRCQLDGTGCSYSRLSIKQDDAPAAFQHPTLRQLSVVVRDAETYRPSLLTVGPWQ